MPQALKIPTLLVPLLVLLRRGPMSRRVICTLMVWHVRLEKGVNQAGGKGIIFNTITIFNGISNGTEGMKYSLLSREILRIR